MPAKGSDETNRERRVTVLFKNTEFEALTLACIERDMSYSEIVRHALRIIGALKTNVQ